MARRCGSHDGLSNLGHLTGAEDSGDQVCFRSNFQILGFRAFRGLERLRVKGLGFRGLGFAQVELRLHEKPLDAESPESLGLR